jgi:tRNA threonylcarbamoyladenosine biosynthesis protein TsaE
MITSQTENICRTEEETFALGERLGSRLLGGEVILLTGGLGAGKTLFTKGILSGLDFDVDEVTSPSFTLVNHYKTERFDVYHIDLWRLEKGGDIAFSVGLNEILEIDNAVIIVEWAEKLSNFSFDRDVFEVRIEGDGDRPRRIEIRSPEGVEHEKMGS